LIGDSGWHIVRLTDGMLAILSEQNYSLFRTATSTARQAKVLEGFDEGTDPMEKHKAAQLLSTLWNMDLLKDPIKRQLMKEHYHLVLRQIRYEDTSGWYVQSEETFPFPDAETWFTPTLYVNNQVSWSPGTPQSIAVMSAHATGTSSYITVISGGWHALAAGYGATNGAVLRCKIDLEQKVKGGAWQISLWSNELTFRGWND
jgi:hypothetical protein